MQHRIKIQVGGRVSPLKNNKQISGVGGRISVRKSKAAASSIATLQGAILNSLNVLYPLGFRGPLLLPNVPFQLEVKIYRPAQVVGDGDNILTTILDAGEGILYPDDKACSGGSFEIFPSTKQYVDIFIYYEDPTH